MKYDSHFDYLSKGAIIRSRATWYEKGKKNNKYSVGLESHRRKKGCIRKIFTSSGHLTSDPKRIMTEVEQFYSDLYSANAGSSNVSYSFLHKPEFPKLTTEKKNICEGILSVKECFVCLQLFENNKSPGDDGLTDEFYKTAFWNSVGGLLVDSLNCAYDRGELSNSRKQAIIKLIEKKEKDKRKICNWRPISLINVDAKIGSKVIATRLQLEFYRTSYITIRMRM